MPRSSSGASAPPDRGGAGLVLFVAGLLVVGAAAPAAPASVEPAPLAGVASLASIYRSILDADFSRAERALAGSCAAPREACQVLKANLIWWRIQLDPASTRHDAAFRAAAEEALRLTAGWTGREPRRAEAWFYLGAAYAVRVQWKVVRNEKLSAARDGARIKTSLERATTLDPDLHDAFFGLGMYQYYADIAPTVLKMLRWLLFLPGGDRGEGLKQMNRARERGELLGDEADYQLALIYVWYEHQPGRALDLLQGLRARHPTNPFFLRQIADIQDAYFHDRPASLESYRTLASAALDRRVFEADLALVEARLGAARQLHAMHETDRALDELAAIIGGRPGRPYAALARAHLLAGQYHDELGRRAAAVEAYRAAVDAAPADEPFGIRDEARAGLRRPREARLAEAYRLSLEGWRHFERRALAEAGAALERSIALNPADTFTIYRHGRLLEAEGKDAAALAAFERVIRMRTTAPATVLAPSLVAAGRVLERLGDRARAVRMYHEGAGVRGGGAEALAAATRALERLRKDPDVSRPRIDTPS